MSSGRPFGKVLVRTTTRRDIFKDDGESSPFISGMNGELIYSDASGYNLYSDGNGFSVLTTANSAYNITITVQGLCLINPPKSNKNFVLTSMYLRLNNFASARRLVLIGGPIEWPMTPGFVANTGITNANDNQISNDTTIRSTTGAGATPITPSRAIIVRSARMLETPKILYTDILTADRREATIPLDGMFIIPPGYFASINGVLASINGNEGLTWYEVDN